MLDTYDMREKHKQLQLLKNSIYCLS